MAPEGKPFVIALEEHYYDPEVAATDFRRTTFWAVKGRRHFGIVIVLFQCDDERLPLRCHICSST